MLGACAVLAVAALLAVARGTQMAIVNYVLARWFWVMKKLKNMVMNLSLLLLMVILPHASAKRDYPLADVPSPQTTGGGTWKVELLYVGVGLAVAITVGLLFLYCLCRTVVATRPTNPPPPGADEAKIDALKTVAYATPPEEEGATECPLCLDEYIEGELLTVLQCEHVFHVHCARKALLLKSCCPCCRLEV